MGRLCRFVLYSFSPSCLLRGAIRVAPVWQRQERCACGFGSAGRTPGKPRTPLYGHYDLCAGSLLDHRSPVAAGRQTTARGSEARSHEHRGGAPKGAPTRVMGRQSLPLKGLAQPQGGHGCGVPHQRLSALRSPLKRGRAKKKKRRKLRAHPAAATRNCDRLVVLFPRHRPCYTPRHE